jgi:hypothetical protein
MYDRKYDPIAEIAEDNWARYALRHGISLRTYPGAFHTDPSKRETYGDKVRFSLYYDVRGIFDVVMFLDIDSVFVNINQRIEETLQGRRFLWTYGDGGPMSGLWIARTDDMTEKHLRFAYERAAAENNTRYDKIEPNGISDQDAMAWCMNVPPFNSTFGNCVEAESVGFCFPDTTMPRPWIVTARGGNIEEKIAALTPWLARTTQPA